MLFVLMFGVSVTTAQSEGAQLRVGHYVFDAPAINLYMNGEIEAGADGTPLLYGSMTLPTQYLDLAAGLHTFAVTAEGEPLESALVAAEEFTLEAGHRYMLAVLGNVSLNDLHFTLIDETAAIAEADINLSAVSIIINNLTGIQSIDGLFDGDLYFDDLVYGDYFVLQDATEGSGTLVIADSNPEAVVLDVPEAVGSPAHFFAVFVFSGTFSGAQWDGYTALYTGQFEGELSILDGGPIAVGEALPLEITEMGQRVQFTLTLEEPAVLDIVESGAAGLDAVVRIYDPSGNLLYENGELAEEDNAEGIGDAGWSGLELEAGTFIIEAATFIDIGTGEFALSVSAAQ
jgi:hypothetical protein